jgi:hypothetical protein
MLRTETLVVASISIPNVPDWLLDDDGSSSIIAAINCIWPSRVAARRPFRMWRFQSFIRTRVPSASRWPIVPINFLLAAPKPSTTCPRQARMRIGGFSE